MFGLKRKSRNEEIEAALAASWLAFAAGAASAVEMTIVQRHDGEVPDDIHHALRAEMRSHVVDMIRSCVGSRIALTDQEIRDIAHKIQKAAVKQIEEIKPELMLLAMFSDDEGLFVKPITEQLQQAAREARARAKA